MCLARYKYLHGSDGAFLNPFDKGCWPNTVEFFGVADCLPLTGTSTDAPHLQSFEERGSLLGNHAGHARYSAPATACGKALGACAGLCGGGHGHSHHGHSHGGHGCCKDDHVKVKDIEDGL